MCAQRFADTVVQAMCEDIATPVALGVYLRIKHRCWDEIAVMAVSPFDYLDAESYFADRIVVDMLRKDASLPTTVDRKAAAVRNFWASEGSCFRANERLSPYLEGKTHPSCDSAIDSFIRVCRKNVRLLLGSRPPASLRGRFGPGSTFGDRGLYTSLPDKMQSQPTVNNGGTSWLQTWSLTAWGKACAAAKRDEVIVRGNRFLTVPKDCRKDRGIAVEPSINVFYQLAFGKAMRRRLECVGVYLDHAQDNHKQVACEASKEGHFATIDLSNASDTVCYNLVKLLLPGEWFEGLDSLRSSHTLMGDHWVKLEKFSSMGNGYTFELETIIFAAICCSVLEVNGIEAVYGQNVMTFGDDIIVPTSQAQNVLAALKFLGFEPNREKSFVDGPFRESCGGDYFLGADVRPHYIKEDVTEPQHLIALANGLWRLRKKAVGVRLQRALSKARFKVLDALPTRVRALRGPEQLGDIVIADDESFWRPSIRHCIRYFHAYLPVRKDPVSWKYFDADVVLASALYLAGSRADSRDDISKGVSSRDSVEGYKIGQVPWS